MFTALIMVKPFAIIQPIHMMNAQQLRGASFAPANIYSGAFWPSQ